MSPTTQHPTPEEEPFVHEECGDTMWDAVLAQPAPAELTPVPALEPPTSTEEDSRPKSR